MLTRKQVEDQCDVLAEVSIDWLVRVAFARAFRDHDAALRAEKQRLKVSMTGVYRDKHAYQWHDEAMAHLKSWHEEVDGLKVQVKLLEDALRALLVNIDLIEYRDRANLRLGEAVPQYVKAQQALTKELP